MLTDQSIECAKGSTAGAPASTILTYLLVVTVDSL